jgi:protein-S-isoprenylcysteine O-methyltransferase
MVINLDKFLNWQHLLAFIFAVSEGVIARRKRGVENSKVDHGSMFLLWLVIGLSIVLCIDVIPRTGVDRYFTAWQMPASAAAFGIVIFCAGFWLRIYSVRYLGKFFTVTVQISDDHQLIDSGPYKCVRHPSYSGALLEVLGIALCIRNWPSPFARLPSMR